MWTGISYALKGHPPEVPRRLAITNTWNHYDFWSVSAVRLCPHCPCSTASPSPVQAQTKHRELAAALCTVCAGYVLPENYCRGSEPEVSWLCSAWGS